MRVIQYNLSGAELSQKFIASRAEHAFVEIQKAVFGSRALPESCIYFWFSTVRGSYLKQPAIFFTVKSGYIDRFNN